MATHEETDRSTSVDLHDLLLGADREEQELILREAGIDRETAERLGLLDA